MKISNIINEKHLKNVDIIREEYQSNAPFPHIVLDNFLEENVANRIIKEIKSDVEWIPSSSVFTNVKDEDKKELNKYYAPSNLSVSEDSLNRLKLNSPSTYSVLSYLQKNALDFFSRISNVDDLIGDKTFNGAGLHKITGGGRLDVHIDFNKNWLDRGLYRRVNLFIYLNEDWKSSYNGFLELWNTNPWRCERKIAPIFNRAVIFNSSKYSYHGHPIPLSCPEDVARYSIAQYYYTESVNLNDDETFRPVSFKE